MYICTEHDEEIIHENRKCPFCDKEADMQQEIDKLEEKVEELKDEVKGLEEQIRETEPEK